jgi:hypothetical protein
MDEYRLLVEWKKSGREVSVRLVELRAARISRDLDWVPDERVDSEDEGAHTLEPAHLVSLEALKDFLADITRTAGPDEDVQLRGTSGQIAEMFEWLNVEGNNPPQPIRIPLP